MQENHKATISTVARINNTDIIIIENGEKRIPIKPICEALGISHKPQIERLKSDPILGSVVTLSVTTGSDGKNYQMVTIPFMFVFGWLFRIDSRNVKPEAREAVMRYQLECYQALYNHFTSYADFVEFRQHEINRQLDAVKAAKREFATAKEKLKDADAELDFIRHYPFNAWKENNRQLKFPWSEDESSEGGER